MWNRLEINDWGDGWYRLLDVQIRAQELIQAPSRELLIAIGVASGKVRERDGDLLFCTSVRLLDDMLEGVLAYFNKAGQPNGTLADVRRQVLDLGEEFAAVPAVDLAWAHWRMRERVKEEVDGIYNLFKCDRFGMVTQHDHERIVEEFVRTVAKHLKAEVVA